MKHTFIIREGHTDLLLFFAGWGMDEHPFERLRPAGCDLLLCSDYHTLQLNTALLASYQRIYVLAWSMGVWAATQLLAGTNLPIAHACAINGTPHPVDEQRGIPPTLFRATINGLSPASLQKFRRRMCGNADALTRFELTLPRRSITELATELEAIYQQSLATSPATFKWHRAVVGSADAIFTPTRQLCAWSETPDTLVEQRPTAHYDEHLIEELCQPTGGTVDKSIIGTRFGKAAQTYTAAATVQQKVATHLLQLVINHNTHQPVSRLLEVGCGTGLYTRPLLAALRPQQTWLNDLAPQMLNVCADLFNAQTLPLLGDAETIALPTSLHVITSCSTLQWFAQPEAFFNHCHKSLADGGTLAFATYGPQNLREVTTLTGQGLRYRSLTELTEALAENYHVVVAQEQTMVLTFASPMEVLQHLRLTGVNAVSTHRWSRTSLAAFINQYTRLFTTPNGGVSLTYHPIYLIAQKR